MSRAKIIDYYLDKLSNPDFEFHQIREELEANNVDEQEIKMIVRVIDNEWQKRATTRASNQNSNELIWIGAVITILGIVITIGTYTGLIEMGNSFMLAYGPVLTGLSILVAAIAMKRR